MENTAPFVIYLFIHLFIYFASHFKEHRASHPLHRFVSNLLSPSFPLSSSFVYGARTRINSQILDYIIFVGSCFHPQNEQERKIFFSPILPTKKKNALVNTQIRSVSIKTFQFNVFLFEFSATKAVDNHGSSSLQVELINGNSPFSPWKLPSLDGSVFALLVLNYSLTYSMHFAL